MLIGSYIGNLGEKHRSAIPKKFLVEIGEKLVIAKWYDGCLILVNVKFWEKILARLTAGTVGLKLGVREIERFILGSAFEVEPDNQGRIVIPEILVKYAELTKDLIYVGLINRLEIWDKQIWDKKSEELSKTTKEFIEGIEK